VLLILAGVLIVGGALLGPESRKVDTVGAQQVTAVKVTG
jgi:hypothetical protein